MDAKLHDKRERLKHFALAALPSAWIFAVVLPLPVSAAQISGTSSHPACHVQACHNVLLYLFFPTMSSQNHDFG